MCIRDSMTIEENLALAYSRSRRGSLGMAVKKSEKEIFKSALAEFGMGLEDRMKTKEMCIRDRP